MIVDTKIECIEKQDIYKSANRRFGIKTSISILFSHKIKGLNFGNFVMIRIFYFRLCLVDMCQRCVKGKGDDSDYKSLEIIKMCV